MCSKTSTGKSTPDFSAQIEKLKKALKNADAVLIGAGTGLSTSAGFTYSGARFETYFSDFAAKYGFSDMYTGGFYPFPTREEFWAYWSRYIFINRYQDAPKPVYNDLLKLVQKKAYFVITTNVDHCFQKAGFDKQRLFYTQGDYGLFQCSEPCRQETWNNETIIREMVRRMNYPLEIVGCPIVREEDGLALSSRNARLSDEERKNALKISQTLFESRTFAASHTVAETQRFVEDAIAAAPGLRLEYFELVDGNTLQKIANWEDTSYAVGCITVFCGEVRLIDNIKYKE